MKTSTFLLLLGFVLLPWCLTPLFSQQNQSSEKKITITKRTVDADGSEVTETIVKKGKAAENFDVDQYLRENRSDKTQVEVKVQEGNDDYKNVERDIVINIPSIPNISWNNTCNDNQAFLGVEEDSDEDASQPGLVVQVTRGSAAERAGLHHNDKILKINEKPINEWGDLTDFMSSVKPGDKVKITYSRNGKEAVTEAAITSRKEVKCDAKNEPKGYLGVFDNDGDPDAEGVEISVVKGFSADNAGLKDGDALVMFNDTPLTDFEDISDFMAYTKPGDKVMVTYDRDGKRNKMEVTLGKQGGLAALEDMNIELPNIEFPNIDWNDQKRSFSGNVNCNVKEKEACLGVYSSDSDDEGAVIEGFTEQSAAEEVGLKNGDVILSINGAKVDGQSELWDEIARYKKGEQVTVAYSREGKNLTVQATLKACRDNQSRVELLNPNDDKDENNRRFYTWNWNDSDRRQLRDNRVIIIRRAGDGDGAKVDLQSNKPSQDRSLALQSFRAYPNPSQGQVTVEFKGEPVETVVSLLDMSGRQLFREELNAFGGAYNQQFDLTAYAKGTIIIRVQQGEKVFTEQIVVN